MDKLELNTKAQELREVLGEDANSPVDVFSLATQINGLTLVFYPLGDNISGMCVKDKEIWVIAVNSAMSLGRQRFSMAHELYHLFFDGESGYNVCSVSLDPKSENERCADQFASYFLAPYKALRTAVNRTAGKEPLTLQHVIALEQYFGMSHLAMLYRLISEGYLSPDKGEEYSHGVVSEARKLGYEDRLYRPAPADQQKRTYGHYLRQVEELRRRDLVSPGKIDELLIDAFREDIAFGLVDSEGETID